jgi:hypothetical protein
MKKRTTRTILIIVGVLIALAVVGVGLAVVLFMGTTEFSTADRSRADEVWREIRGRFRDAQPLLEVRDHETAVLSREPPTNPAHPPLESLNIVAWDAEDASLFRMSLPFWMLRLKSGTFTIGEGIHARRLDVTVEDLERFGPALVVDHEDSGGDRVLVWTE